VQACMRAGVYACVTRDTHRRACARIGVRARSRLAAAGAHVQFHWLT